MGYFEYVKTLPLALDKGEQRALLEEFYKTRDESIREKIISHNLRLCSYCVGQIIGKGNDYDDYMQLATIELVDVLDNKYDINRSAEFSTYAYVCICNALLKDLKKNIRDEGRYDLREDMFELVERANNNVSLDEIGKVAVESVAEKTMIDDFCETLDDRVKYIFESVFGLNDRERKTIEELSKELNLSSSRVGALLLEAKNNFRKFYVAGGQDPSKLKTETLIDYYNNSADELQKVILQYYLGLNGCEKLNLTEIARKLNLRKTVVYAQMTTILKSCGNTVQKGVTEKDLFNYYKTTIVRHEVEILEYYLGINGKEKITDPYGIADELNMKFTEVYASIRSIHNKIRKAMARENITHRKEILTIEDLYKFYADATDVDREFMDIVYGLNGNKRLSIKEVAEHYGVTVEGVQERKRRLERRIKDNLFVAEQM